MVLFAFCFSISPKNLLPHEHEVNQAARNSPIQTLRLCVIKALEGLKRSPATLLWQFSHELSLPPPSHM